jgi:HAE1 family hydrophobic/amphiphilic exporter-1
VTLYDKTIGRVTGFFDRSTDRLADVYHDILDWSLRHGWPPWGWPPGFSC